MASSVVNRSIEVCLHIELWLIVNQIGKICLDMIEVDQFFNLFLGAVIDAPSPPFEGVFGHDLIKVNLRINPHKTNITYDVREGDYEGDTLQTVHLRMMYVKVTMKVTYMRIMSVKVTCEDDVHVHHVREGDV